MFGVIKRFVFEFDGNRTDHQDPSDVPYFAQLRLFYRPKRFVSADKALRIFSEWSNDFIKNVNEPDGTRVPCFDASHPDILVNEEAVSNVLMKSGLH